MIRIMHHMISYPGCNRFFLKVKTSLLLFFCLQWGLFKWPETNKNNINDINICLHFLKLWAAFSYVTCTNQILVQHNQNVKQKQKRRTYQCPFAIHFSETISFGNTSNLKFAFDKNLKKKKLNFYNEEASWGLIFGAFTISNYCYWQELSFQHGF